MQIMFVASTKYQENPIQSKITWHPVRAKTYFGVTLLMKQKKY
jgi:hypothetical protein